jgi:hypothetical protein
MPRAVLPVMMLLAMAAFSAQVRATKASIDLQDLRRRLYVKAKADTSWPTIAACSITARRWWRRRGRKPPPCQTSAN